MKYPQGYELQQSFFLHNLSEILLNGKNAQSSAFIRQYLCKLLMTGSRAGLGRYQFPCRMPDLLLGPCTQGGQEGTRSASVPPLPSLHPCFWAQHSALWQPDPPLTEFITLLERWAALGHLLYISSACERLNSVMLESDNTGLLTLFGGNDTQWWMSLQPLCGQPMLQTLGQDFMYLREAGRCMGKEEKFSSTGVGNWKKHSSAF